MQADLEFIVQLNFLVDLTYLMSHLHPQVLESGKVPMVVIYGSTDTDSAQRITKVYIPSPRLALLIVTDYFVGIPLGAVGGTQTSRSVW